MNQCFFFFPLPKCTLCVTLNFQVNRISFIGSQIHCPSKYLDKGLSLYNNLTFSASSFSFPSSSYCPLQYIYKLIDQVK